MIKTVTTQPRLWIAFFFCKFCVIVNIFYCALYIQIYTDTIIYNYSCTFNVLCVEFYVARVHIEFCWNCPHHMRRLNSPLLHDVCPPFFTPDVRRRYCLPECMEVLCSCIFFIPKRVLKSVATVITHGTSRLRLDGFSWNFVFQIVAETCWLFPFLVEIGQK